MNDKKSKISVTLTRKEADWLLNLLDRESEARANTEGDPNKISIPRVKYAFTAASLADRVRAEG